MNSEESKDKDDTHSEDIKDHKKPMTAAERVAKMRDKEKQIKSGTYIKTAFEMAKE